MPKNSELYDIGHIIDGNTRICALIGDPVEHTLSPLIHNTLAALLGHDMVYIACRVDADAVDTAVRGAYEMGFLGLNVTVPHKVTVMDSVTELDPVASAIGSVNTLVRSEDGYKGFNTDILGLRRALTVEGISLEGEDVVLLGAGGAARAAAFLCAEDHARSLRIINRSIDRAAELAHSVNLYAGFELADVLTPDERGGVDGHDMIAIQATSMGLYPDTGSVLISDEEFYRHFRFGFDMVYRPADTRFMKLMRDAGGVSQNGLGMLLYQAIEAYELWNGIKVPDNVAKTVAERLREAIDR